MSQELRVIFTAVRATTHQGSLRAPEQGAAKSSSAVPDEAVNPRIQPWVGGK